MIQDITAVVWKELKEVLVRGGKRNKISLIIFIGIFAVMMPLQWGSRWLTSPAGLIFLSWMPLLIVSGVVTDGIAGERERHTLETLLASRLSDGAILLGKIAAAVIYGLIQSWLIALVSVIAVNAVFWTGRIMFYSSGVFLAILVFPVLMAVLSAASAALVSLRAETARQAQQTMSISFIIIFIPVILINFLSQSAKESIGTVLARINWAAVPYYIGGIMVLADIVLLLIAEKKFKRQRLALE